MPSSCASDRDRQAGFAVGKRVWIKDCWDGALLAKRLGEYAEGMRIGSERIDGRITVILGDGTPEPIRKDLLRLTPPRGLSNRQEKAKERKPKARKEAVAPQYGRELTIIDALEE